MAIDNWVPMRDDTITTLRHAAAVASFDDIRVRQLKAQLGTAVEEIAALKAQYYQQREMAHARYTVRCGGTVLTEQGAQECPWVMHGVPTYDARAELILHQQRSPDCNDGAGSLVREKEEPYQDPELGIGFAAGDEVPIGLPEDMMDDPDVKVVRLGEGGFMAFDPHSAQPPGPTKRIELPKE